MQNPNMETAVNNKDIRQFQHVCRRYVTVLNAVIAAIPVAALLYWALFNRLPDWMLAELPVRPTLDLSNSMLLLGFLVSLLPISVALYALVTLKELFQLYARGIMFSVENVQQFRRLGFSLFAWVIAVTLFAPLISIVMSLSSSLPDRQIVAQIGIVDVLTLAIGGIFLIISWVMNEGRKMEDEQAHTI